MKVISKMGISTIQSYHGAQVFEAVGLNQDFIDEYFTWTATRVGGVGIDVDRAARRGMRNERGFPPRRPSSTPACPPAASTSGARAASTTSSTRRRCTSSSTPAGPASYPLFKEYTRLVNDQSRNLNTLRGLMDLLPGQRPVPLEEVEPVERSCAGSRPAR